MFPMDAVLAAIAQVADAAKQLKLDERKIDDVKAKLRASSGDLGSGTFKHHAPIADASFGGTSDAADLGFHHTLAYEVVDDTLKGVVKDLDDFHASVVNAVQLVKDADTTASGDYSKRQGVIDTMDHVWQHSAGDAANHSARNHHVPAGAGH